MGRRKTKGGTRQWTPASEWIWTPEPTHTALVNRNVWVREEPLMAAIAGFFTDRVFGPDRAAMLDATLPRTAAAQAARDAARAGTLRKKLAKIDVSETALISELENTPEGMPEPAVAAYRQRLRARFTELYTERTTLQAQLDTLTTPSDEPASDPALLDELPFLGDIVTNAPTPLIERLLAIFDLSAVYNRDKHQLTIHATITPATPQAIRDLLLDPRADHNQPASQPGPTGQDHVSHPTGPPGSSPRTELVPGRRLGRVAGPTARYRGGRLRGRGPSSGPRSSAGPNRRGGRTRTGWAPSAAAAGG